MAIIVLIQKNIFFECVNSTVRTLFVGFLFVCLFVCLFLGGGWRGGGRGGGGGEVIKTSKQTNPDLCKVASVIKLRFIKLAQTKITSLL